MTSRKGQLVTDHSHNPPEISIGEAQLIALMALDAAVHRARASGEDDEERQPDRRRRPPTAETRAKLSAAAKRRIRTPLSDEARAKIAEKMRGNANAKRNPVVSPTEPRKDRRQ